MSEWWLYILGVIGIAAWVYIVIKGGNGIPTIWSVYQPGEIKWPKWKRKQKK